MSEVLQTVYISQNNLKWKSYLINEIKSNPIKKVFNKIKKILKQGFDT